MLHAFVLFAQDPKQESAPIWVTFLPLIIIFVLFYFLLILPERRRERRQREELNSKLKKNDRVLTTSGIIAVVANIKDEEVTLRIDDTARLTVLRSAIARIITAEDQAKESAKGSEAVKAGAPPK